MAVLAFYFVDTFVLIQVQSPTPPALLSLPAAPSHPPRVRTPTAHRLGLRGGCDALGRSCGGTRIAPLPRPRAADRALRVVQLFPESIAVCGLSSTALVGAASAAIMTVSHEYLL